MQNSKEILNWHFNPTHFKRNGERIFDKKTVLEISKSSQQLQNLVNRLPPGIPPPSDKGIEKIYYQFDKNYSKGKDYLLTLFGRKDIRVLIWALDFKPSANKSSILFSDKFTMAISIIYTKWKDSYLISLWQLLLRNWTKLHQHSSAKRIIEKLLTQKAATYNGDRRNIKSLANNMQLFVSQAPYQTYAQHLLEKDIPLDYAHNLINQKETVLSFDYYGLAAESYLDLLLQRPVQEDKLVSIYDFLKKHNTKKSNLFLCSKIINSSWITSFPEMVKSKSIELIEDPTVKSSWGDSSLSHHQNQLIESARNRLNILINKDFIEVFFEKLIQDERRKKYWLKFIDKIEDIRCCGSRASRFLLAENKNISNYVNARFKVTTHNQQTCALVIYSKGYVFIEFSDTGSLYIYKKDNFKVNLNNLTSMADLKLTNHMACRTTGYGYLNVSPQGRITHQGNWEPRVDAWMKEYYD